MWLNDYACCFSTTVTDLHDIAFVTLYLMEAFIFKYAVHLWIISVIACYCHIVVSAAGLRIWNLSYQQKWE